MGSVTLNRTSNLMLMGRRFKIYIDGNLCDQISDGEIKKIEIPPDSKELTVKVMNYVSQPIKLDSIESESYVIKQDVYSSVATYCLVALAAAHITTKYVFEQEQAILLYIAAPFLLVSIYYSTFGRRNVLRLKKENLD